MLFPGQSETVTIDVPNPRRQSIHFEAMYGNTKDTCATFTVAGARLAMLGDNDDASDIAGTDLARATGAFADPVVPAGATSGTLCGSATSAIDCLRTLAPSASGSPSIRAFPGYLPSLVSLLESIYGSADVETLIIPSGGAVSYRITAVH